MSQRTCNLEDFVARLKSRGAAYATNASDDSCSLSQRALDDAINLEAEKLAHEMNLWMPINDTFKLGIPTVGGVENENYLKAEEGVIYKVNNLLTSHNVLSLLERLTLHNMVFPQTAYELVAFSGFGRRSIYPVLRQVYVPQATYATHGEILDYMESMGFLQVGEAAFSNGDIVISDLRPRNVLKSKGNAIYVVDADFKRVDQP